MSTLVVIFAVLLCVTAQAVDVHQDYVKNYSEPLLLDHYKIAQNVNQHLMYTYCDNRTDPLYFNCQYKLKSMNGTEKHCDVMHPVPKDGQDHVTHKSLKSMLGGKKAVFEWSLRDHEKWITIVDMDTCKPVHLTFPLDEGDRMIFHFLAFGNSFDVSLKSSEKCGEKYNPCILRYNLEGEPIRKPLRFPLIYYRGETLLVSDLLHSVRERVVTFNMNKYHGLNFPVHVSQESYTGFETIQVDTYNYGDVSSKMSYSMVVSNEYGYYTVCHPIYKRKIKSKNFRCIQHDEKGIKINVTVELDYDYTVLRVFNKRQDGIILLYVICRNFSDIDCLNEKIKVKEVSVNGLVITDAELNMDNLDDVKDVEELSIEHLGTGTQHCFYFAYAKKTEEIEKTIFKHVAKCINRGPTRRRRTKKFRSTMKSN